MRRLAVLIVAIAVLVGCQKEEELKVNTEVVVLNSSDEHIITSNGTNVRFSSQNPFVASVNSTTGQVTGMHVGETFINVLADEGEVSVRVTVEPRYNVLIDPYINWSATRNDIVNKLGKPYSSSTTQLIYQYGDANKGDSHIGTSYVLDDKGFLKNIMVVINSNNYASVILHLDERYQAMGNSGTTIVFGDAMNSDDVKMTVTIGKYSGQYVILYSPRD